MGELKNIHQPNLQPPSFFLVGFPWTTWTNNTAQRVRFHGRKMYLWDIVKVTLCLHPLCLHSEFAPESHGGWKTSAVLGSGPGPVTFQRRFLFKLRERSAGLGSRYPMTDPRELVYLFTFYHRKSRECRVNIPVPWILWWYPNPGSPTTIFYRLVPEPSLF